MIVPDANVLLYAYDIQAPGHRPSRIWWEGALSGVETVGLSWQVITAFLRISTSTRAYLHPLSGQEALAIVQSWLERPMVRIITPSGRHWEIIARLILEGQATGPLVMDAHLAALAIENGATLCTHDADFTRFPGLRIYDPLAM